MLTLLLWFFPNYRQHLTGSMSCPEYNRLRQLYEATLRRWGHVRFSPDARLVSIEARQKVFDERRVAKERLSAHTLSCPACNPELKTIRSN
jgi:hypothetical protein